MTLNWSRAYKDHFKKQREVKLHKQEGTEIQANAIKNNTLSVTSSDKCCIR